MQKHFSLLVLFLWGCFFINLAVADEVPVSVKNFTLESQQIGADVSYTLQSDQKVFFTAALDALKSGKELVFTHYIKLYKLGGWRPKKVADTKVIYQVSYNLMENVFTFKKGDDTYRISGEKGLAKELFSVSQANVALVKDYDPGTEFLAKIAFSFEDAGKKNVWVSRVTPRWFTPKMTAEVLYIGR